MYLRRLIKREVARVVKGLYGSGAPEFEVTFPRESSHGDYSINFPLKASKVLKKPPMVLAEELKSALSGIGPFSRIDVAKPGFVNLFLSPDFLTDKIETLAAGPSVLTHYRVSPVQSIHIEYVSANPTGPLTVGHGRNACIGDGLARLMNALGHRVHREYYFNNAGRQMKILAESLRARVLEESGRPVVFPEEGYIGEYIRDIAKALIAAEGPSVADRPIEFFQKAAEDSIFKMIQATLENIGVGFDAYFNEDQLYKDGSVQKVLDALKSRDLTYEKDGAVWFRGEAAGLPKDPVLVKKGGEPTYRLPDVAYHIQKLSRRSDLIIDVLGADHIDEHREVHTILRALGHAPETIRGIIYQFVTLVRGGKPVKMSTRRAEYVTLDELLEEVGADVARFFFLSRRADTHLEFDIELAKKESQENPVYYVQYAHARLSGIFRTAAEQGFTPESIQASKIDLTDDRALVLSKKILSLGDVMDACAQDLEVTGLLIYLRELAEAFHIYYTEVRVVDGLDRAGNPSRLKLCGAVQKILKDVLTTLGIRAPDRM